MKTIITCILCIAFQIKFFAQDILVKSNGEKIACKIVEVDSSLLAYQSEDTTKKEIILLQKQDVLAMQQNHQKTIFFFVPDTLIQLNGTKTICKIITIDPGFISFLPVDSTIGDLTMAPNNNFSLIHFGNGSSEVVEHKDVMVTNDSKSKLDFYKMGQNDAKKYFKTGGIVVGEVACGLGTYFIGLGLIGGVVIYATPPKNLYNPANPNNDLLNSNADYHAGYLAGAKHEKHKKAAIGYTCGVLAPIATVGVIIAVLLYQI